MSAPFAPSSFYDVGLAFKNLADHLDLFGDRFDRLEQRLAALESKNPLPAAKPPSASPSAPAAPKPSQAKPMNKEKAKAPTAPTTRTPAPQSIRSTTLSKVVPEKMTSTLSITDDQAGHIVGRAGSGLKQVHDISGAKVLVSVRGRRA